jgi:tRNA uridine 5-carboxymethylaminomethyl modification enzyme
MAGINAALAARAEPPLVLQRDEAYLGVLIDDLVTRGTTEPYRMFTSRAEHRLLLRIDNADLRLTPMGRRVGLVSDERWDRFSARKSRLERNLDALSRTSVVSPSGQRVSASQALRQPEIRLAALVDANDVQLQLAVSDRDLDILSAETTVKYAGYLKRQEQVVERNRKQESHRIPAGFPYERVAGLSREMVQRFTQIQPETLGQALRIPGATPAAVAVLAAYVRTLGSAPRTAASSSEAN